MIVSLILFATLPVGLKMTSVLLRTPVRDVARSSLVSLFFALLLSSLESSLLHVCFPVVDWEYHLFLFPLLILGNGIFGSYSYSVLFQDSYVSALTRNGLVTSLCFTMTIVMYLTLLALGFQ